MTENTTLATMTIDELKDLMHEVFQEENGDTESIARKLIDASKDTGEEWGKEKALDFLYESGKDFLIKDLNEWTSETFRLLVGGAILNLSLIFGYLSMAIIVLAVFYLLRRYHVRLSHKFCAMGIISLVMLFLLKC